MTILFEVSLSKNDWEKIIEMYWMTENEANTSDSEDQLKDKIKFHLEGKVEEEMVVIPISEKENKHFTRWWYICMNEGFIDGDEEYARIGELLDNQTKGDL